MFMDGSVKLKDFSDDVLRAMQRQCSSALEQIGSVAEQHARNIVNSAGLVDTRELRRSISHAVNGNNVYIGTNNPHAIFHEFGTGRFTRQHASEKYGVKPVHFIKKAAVNHRKKYRSIMLDAMKK